MPKSALWTKEEILIAIRSFVVQRGIPPGRSDFEQGICDLPSLTTVCRNWPSWQSAVVEAGYVPQTKQPRERMRQYWRKVVL